MATTTNYGWTTPDDTALVKDGASAIRTLGTSVDTTTKNLNPETTLGDISFRSSTSNVNTRLGIGATGTVLTVAGGVPSWATPGAANPTTADAVVTTQENTTSTSYTNLTTSGPAVTITTGTKALVIVGASAGFNNGANNFMSFAVSGATTIAAADSFAFCSNTTGGSGNAIGSHASVQTLTAGSNTFTAKYKVSSGDGYFSNRRIFVMNLN